MAEGDTQDQIQVNTGTAAAPADQTPLTQPQPAPNPVTAPVNTAPPKSVLDPTDEYEDDEEIGDGIPLEKSNKRIYLIGIVISLLVIGTTAAVLYLRSKQPTEKSQEVVTEVTEEVSEEPVTETTETAEEVEQLERDEISLEILNGSGVSGLAGKTADTFEALGYTIADTGNATATEGNELYVNPDYADMIEVLLSDVEDELNITSVSGDLDDSDATARIILGS
jgi:hypothetical protein